MSSVEAGEEPSVGPVVEVAAPSALEQAAASSPRTIREVPSYDRCDVLITVIIDPLIGV